jgi:hypothetical protein
VHLFLSFDSISPFFRTLDLPCASEKLDHDMKPPFTCGGATRRAIIKYFVRQHINGNAGVNGGTSLTEKLIREQIKKLQTAWGMNISNFACKGNGDGNYSFKNCDVDNPSTYLPPGLNVSFDAIAGSDVLKAITKKIWPYIQEALVGANSNAEFKLYNRDPAEVAGWNWMDRDLGHIARDDGLYDSQRAVVNYSAGETAYPFIRGTSIWDMCTGMVSQVMFTMPMTPIQIDEHQSWTVSSVLGLRTDALKFDPALETDFGGIPPTELSGLSMLERYVNKLLQDSFTDSPTFWHYAMRHVPSDSQVFIPRCASCSAVLY